MQVCTQETLQVNFLHNIKKHMLDNMLDSMIESGKVLLKLHIKEHMLDNTIVHM